MKQKIKELIQHHKSACEEVKELLNELHGLEGKDVNMSYHFFPTGIGTAVKVKSETLGIEEDITDFKNW